MYSTEKNVYFNILQLKRIKRINKKNQQNEGENVM